MDALGASFGIRRIAEMNGKKCYVVVDQNNIHTDIQRLLEEVKGYPEIAVEVLSPEEAVEKATANSLLVMVDHSKPSITMAPKLYEKLAQRTIVLDHHRRGKSSQKTQCWFISNPTPLQRVS